MCHASSSGSHPLAVGPPTSPGRGRPAKPPSRASTGRPGVGAVGLGAQGGGGGTCPVDGFAATGGGARWRSARAVSPIAGALACGGASRSAPGPNPGPGGVGSDCSTLPHGLGEIGFGRFAVGGCVRRPRQAHAAGPACGSTRSLPQRTAARSPVVAGACSTSSAAQRPIMCGAIGPRAAGSVPGGLRRSSFTSSNAREETPWIHGFTWPWSSRPFWPLR